jgi:CheY-like chemotaxis protein
MPQMEGGGSGEATCMTERDQPVVLIADDSENDVIMLRRAFRLASVVTPVQVVTDGEEAIAYLKGEGKFAHRDEYPLPDLLLLDLKMPRKNGFEVLEWLQGQPTLARLRVVVLTTSEDLRDVNRAYSLGAASFLTKPLDFLEFKDTIQAMTNYWTTLNRAPSIERPPLRNPLAQGDTN